MDLANLLPTALSLGAAASSVYLWVVQSRREAPRLRLHLGRRRPRHAGQYASASEQMRDCHLEAELIVTNLSTMPDVLTGVALRIRTGEAGWLPLRLTRDPSQRLDAYTTLPIALPPRSSARLFLRLGFDVPRGLEPGELLSSPLQLGGVLLGLGGRRHKVLAVAHAA